MLAPNIAHALARSGKRIVVTGAGGWLGLATLECLAEALGEDFQRRVVAIGSSVRTLHLRNGSSVEQRPLEELSQFDPAPTWLLHFAFLTKDRAETMNEADYCGANTAIRTTVLRTLDKIGVEAVFVASSGAVYKAHDPGASPAMRLYGQLKAEDERAFAQWGEKANRRVVIARIFNVTGPYINKHQAYALASFILGGLAGRPIKVRAPHPVVRGFVPISELMSLVFAELSAGASGCVSFDTGGEALELGQVAAVVATCFDGIAVHRAPITNDVPDVYHGDDARYAAMLARHGIEPLPLARQIAKTIDYFRAQQ